MCGCQVHRSWNTNHISPYIQSSNPSRSRSFGLDAPSSWPSDNLRTCCGAKRYRCFARLQHKTVRGAGAPIISSKYNTLAARLPAAVANRGHCVFADILMFTPLCVVSQPQTPMPRDCRSILLARLKRRFGCMRTREIGYRFGTHCMSSNSYT